MQSNNPPVHDGAAGGAAMAVPDVTIAEQVACVDRELGMRNRVYPRWVKAGKLTQTAADLEISRMTAVRWTLRRAQIELTDREPGQLFSGEVYGPAKVRADERAKVLAAVLHVAGQDTVYRVVAHLQKVHGS